MAEIVVVDDEEDIRVMLTDYLGAAGHVVRAVGDATALAALLDGGPAADLFVLDVNLPGRSGFDVARELRVRLDPGILMLTGAGSTLDRIVGLEVGADDYLAKPFDLSELEARIAAILRRRAPAAPGRPFGRFSFDFEAFCLRDAEGGVVELSAMEVDLVAAFATNPGRVLSREELMRLAPPRDDESYDRSIDHRVQRLRRKLEEAPDFPQLIRTVRGGGYVFSG